MKILNKKIYIYPNMTECVFCQRTYSKSYYKKHLQSKKHIRNSSEGIPRQKTTYTIPPQDIRLFFHRSVRTANDRTNKIREDILCNILDKDFLKQYSDTKFYEDWLLVYRNFLKSVSILYHGLYDKIYVSKKAGRGYNYDFEISFLYGGKTVYKGKLEFKYGTSLFNYPQFISIYTESSKKMIHESFAEFWYKNFIDEYIQVGNLPRKPRIETYMRLINNTSYCHPFFQKTRGVLKKNNNISSCMKQVANKAIKMYIQKYANNLDMSSLQNIFLSQKNKIFIFCNNGEFSIESLDDYLDLSGASISTTHNSIHVKTEKTIFKLLLRWKNYKGCCGPAWQISIRQK